MKPASFRFAWCARRAAASNRRAPSTTIAACSLVILLSLLSAGTAFASGCNGSCDSARAVVVDSHGRIVVAGGCEGVPGGESVTLWRLTEDGTPDATFGDGGVARGSAAGSAGSVVIAPDDTLFVPYVNSGEVLVMRYSPDGEILGPLADDVGLSAPWNGSFRSTRLVARIDSRGGIIVAEQTEWHEGGSSRLELRRFQADGTRDPTFGVAAYAHPPPVPGGSTAIDMTVDESGRIVVVGSTQAGATVWRFGPDGTPDTDFGEDGVVTQNTTNSERADMAIGVVIDDEGRMLVTGLTIRPVTVGDETQKLGALTLWGLTPDGRLDESFGEDGHVVVSEGLDGETPGGSGGEVVRIDPESRIVVYGWVGHRGPAVWRFLPDGTPDETYGEGGFVVVEDLYERLRFHGAPAMDVDTSGRVVAVGWINGNEFDVGICRLDADGSVDQSFGTDGFVRYDHHHGFTGLRWPPE